MIPRLRCFVECNHFDGGGRLFGRGGGIHGHLLAGGDQSFLLRSNHVRNRATLRRVLYDMVRPRPLRP